MERHPIRRPSGFRVIGGIGEGNGFGFRAIGRGDRSPMPIGSLAVGNQEMGDGPGSRAIGSTDKRVKSGELRVKNLNLIIQNS